MAYIASLCFIYIVYIYNDTVLITMMHMWGQVHAGRPRRLTLSMLKEILPLLTWRLVPLSMMQDEIFAIAHQPGGH